jgi:hypothetical protein
LARRRNSENSPPAGKNPASGPGLGAPSASVRVLNISRAVEALDTTLVVRPHHNVWAMTRVATWAFDGGVDPYAHATGT